MGRFIARTNPVDVSMESLAIPDFPTLIANDITGEYGVSMESLASVVESVKKWLKELLQKIKHFLSGDTFWDSSAKTKVTKLSNNESIKSFQANTHTALRLSGNVNIAKYTTTMFTAQSTVIDLAKTLANNHNTVFSALRNKETEVRLPDVSVDAVGRYMDLTSNGQTISVNMKVADITLSVNSSDIDKFRKLLEDLNKRNSSELDAILKRVSNEGTAILSMTNPDPNLLKLAGSLEAQIIKLSSISKLVFVTELDRVLGDLLSQM